MILRGRRARLMMEMTLVLFIRARRWRGAAGNPEAIAEATADIVENEVEMQ
jgi:hypothetical protein